MLLIAATKWLSVKQMLSTAEKIINSAFPLNFGDSKSNYDLNKITLPDNSLISNLWDLIHLNQSRLVDQIRKKQSRDVCIDWSGVSINGRSDNITVLDGVEFDPHVHIDARGGPVFIGEDSRIGAFTRIHGPAYIGKGCEIRSAFVGKGSSIGNFCKIGGELDSSIIEEYSNKSHEGYLGHSYIGKWVNIGAGTNISNLKNTYGTIRMETTGGRVDTGMVKLGAFLADYSKTAIGSLIYSGRKLGVCSQAHGHLTNDVPSFTIYAKDLGSKSCEIQLESACETQKRMLSRRGLKQTETDVNLLQSIFKSTMDERRNSGVLDRRFTL